MYITLDQYAQNYNICTYITLDQYVQNYNICL